MRRTEVRGILLVVYLLVVAVVSGYGAPKAMSVTVREAPVRSTPSFLGQIITDLPYGSRVEIVETREGWTQVRLPDGRRGWLHTSELTEQKLALRAGGDVNQSASSSEVALAGKGFNKQVENQYKSEKNLDYTWVNRMEKISYKPGRLITFLEAGDLHGEHN